MIGRGESLTNASSPRFAAAAAAVLTSWIMQVSLLCFVTGLQGLRKAPPCSIHRRHENISKSAFEVHPIKAPSYRAQAAWKECFYVASRRPRAATRRPGARGRRAGLATSFPWRASLVPPPVSLMLACSPAGGGVCEPTSPLFPS